MRNRPRRRLNAAGFMASLLILIGLIFLIDKVYRLIRPAPAENIVGIGEFAASNSANSSDGSNTDSTDANDSDSTSSGSGGQHASLHRCADIFGFFHQHELQCPAS